MLRQAENKVTIEGILSEIDLKYSSFAKNGKNVESIGGTIKVKVNQQINGESKNLEIPVHMFASKLTNKGTANPAYESIERVMNSYTSIAAVGGEAGADYVRITNANINMNEYHGSDGRLISFPRINASFVTKAKKEEVKPQATFVVEFVVAASGYDMDSDGNEIPNRYKVRGVVPQYGGRVDIVDFIVQTPNAIDAISNYWSQGDTVKAQGRLNFSSTIETVTEEVDFGEPIERTRTINVSELIITGGSQTPLDGEFAYDENEIKQALADRKARLEAQKEKDMNRAKQRNAPAQSEKKGSSFDDVGF